MPHFVSRWMFQSHLIFKQCILFYLNVSSIIILDTKGMNALASALCCCADIANEVTMSVTLLIHIFFQFCFTFFLFIRKEFKWWWWCCILFHSFIHSLKFANLLGGHTIFMHQNAIFNQIHLYVSDRNIATWMMCYVNAMQEPNCNS